MTFHLLTKGHTVPANQLKISFALLKILHSLQDSRLTDKYCLFTFLQRERERESERERERESVRERKSERGVRGTE